MFARSPFFAVLSIVLSCTLLGVMVIHTTLPHDHSAPEFGGLMLVLHMVEQKALALPSFVVVLLVIIVSSQRVSLIARERRMLQFGDPDPLSAFSRKGYFSPKAY